MTAGNGVRLIARTLLWAVISSQGLRAAQTVAARPALIDAYVATEMRAQQIPGLSLAVLRDGRPLYLQSYGVATLEHRVPVKPGTLFQLGSIGKQFTATAVLLLARERRLDLDDPLSKYLPEIPPGWRAVTLRDMLKHQSGIAQLTPPDHELLDLRHDYTDEEYIRLATSLPLEFEPGTDAAYSDTAYVLLGIVIGRLTGQFYGDLLQEKVFHPLGMTRTRIISDSDIIPDRASGYERSPSGALQNQGWVAPALNRTADGSLYSTVLDLAKWDQALSAGTILTRGELARAWTVDALKDGSTPLLHYGYGWEINTLRGHRVIEYDGNWQGFQAAMARYEDRHLTVIVLTNLALCRVQRIVHTIAGYFDPTVAHFAERSADGRPAMTREFGTFIAGAAQGRLTAVRLSPDGRRELSRVWLRALARDLRETGPIQGVSFAEERDAGIGLERVYRVDTRQMVDYFTVRYRRDGLIEAIDLYHEY